MEARSFFFQAGGGRRNDERAQHWKRKNLSLLRRLNLSPQFHGHRVPRMLLKGRLLFFDPLRVAFGVLFIKWTKMERELCRHVDQLLGRNLSPASDYPVAIYIVYLFTYCT